MAQRKSGSASIQVEIAGWAGFLLYVALVYRLRRALNRHTDTRSSAGQCLGGDEGTA
jgi:hypothetical protein